MINWKLRIIAPDLTRNGKPKPSETLPFLLLNYPTLSLEQRSTDALDTLTRQGQLINSHAHEAVPPCLPELGWFPWWGVQRTHPQHPQLPQGVYPRQKTGQSSYKPFKHFVLINLNIALCLVPSLNCGGRGWLWEKTLKIGAASPAK